MPVAGVLTASGVMPNDIQSCASARWNAANPASAGRPGVSDCRCISASKAGLAERNC